MTWVRWDHGFGWVRYGAEFRCILREFHVSPCAHTSFNVFSIFTVLPGRGMISSSTIRSASCSMRFAEVGNVRSAEPFSSVFCLVLCDSIRSFDDFGPSFYSAPGDGCTSDAVLATEEGIKILDATSALDEDPGSLSLSGHGHNVRTLTGEIDARISPRGFISFNSTL